jgi:hypothetical protein
MRDRAVSFLRTNAFLVAAAVLPLAVVAVFLVASAVPRWTVPPPAYDAVLRGVGPFDEAAPRVTVEFTVRDGRVEATVRPQPGSGWAQSVGLFLYHHESNEIRRIPLDLPQPTESEPSRTVIIDAFEGRRVVAGDNAPDGYQVQSRDRDGPGLVGELFGIGPTRRRIALVNRGRVVPLTAPEPYAFGYQPQAVTVGWIVDDPR